MKKTKNVIIMITTGALSPVGTAKRNPKGGGEVGYSSGRHHNRIKKKETVAKMTGVKKKK